MIRDKNLNFHLLLTAILVYSSRPRFCRGQGNSTSSNSCDTVGCGPFGICDAQDSRCTCFPKFNPRVTQEWDAGNWTNGCERRVPLNCEGNNGTIREDGFMRLKMMKISQYSDRWDGRENQCGDRCLRNCSCIAYAFDNGIGCMFWFGTLNNVQKFPSGSGAGSASTLDLYIRLARSELGSCIETDTITTSLIIEDPQTIVSSGKIFRLGFFSPGNSTSRYMGIWYNVSETSIIWVANRDKPLINGGSITISGDGNLVLMSRQKDILWSSNISNSSNNTNAQLLDTGNLVLRDNSNGRLLWESFRHPADTFVPTMEVTDNVSTGEKVLLTSWKTPMDPDYGNFSAGLQALSIPQIFIWNGKRPHWRSGPWNGLSFTGVRSIRSVYLNGFSLSKQSDGTVSFTRDNLGDHDLMRILLKPNGSYVQTNWDEAKGNWKVRFVAPLDTCDVYGVCGHFGSCSMRNSPICSCLKGYKPVNKEEWDRGNWSGGCERLRVLQCDRSDNSTNKSRADRFSKLTNVKVPDFIEAYSQKVKDECQSLCLGNCSCIAYSHDPGIGCMFWRDTLIDVRQYPNGGSDLYIRVAFSVIDEKREKVIIIVPVTTGFGAIFACLFVSWVWRTNKIGVKRKGKLREKTGVAYQSDSSKIVLRDDMDSVSLKELPLYSFGILENATDQFSVGNLLGKGGFGPVYKGKLENGKEIAVKRLSATSGQGLREFMNEVVVISKLQHRNLVSLLGCCVEKEEKMLIYEFMANRSLDVFLFDQSQEILDWRKRFNIMEGIGRGLLYLHRDSRLRIIHRDLKPSNVLLDENWNPKISDFGIAKIFGAREDQADTARVVGTYGYMAPEYVSGGRFSEKSDVFSFGVIVLEIISGRKNTSFYNDEFALSLLEHAWKIWNDGNFEALIDERISVTSFKAEIIRCMHIGLLCVQEFPYNRPTMSNVLAMLGNEIAHLPVLEQPTFTHKQSRNRSSLNQTGGSNNVSITVLEGR